jgi:hypothetical protein
MLMSTNAMYPNGDAPPPARRVVASYARHEDAARAVDYLAENKFPIERVAIVGRELEVVEQVTGKPTVGDAVFRGAITGAVTGILIGWLFALFTWFDPRVASGWLIFDGFWFGTLVGALFGLFIYLVTRNQRRFATIPMMVPQYYDIVVDELYADDAARMLEGLKLPTRVRVEPPSTVKSSTGSTAQGAASPST